MSGVSSTQPRRTSAPTSGGSSTGAPRPSPPRAPGRPSPRFERAATAAYAAALVLGVLLRVFSASTLWLDEALSVNIASLPLLEVFPALRQDGSPPLYYLLLHGWIAVFGAGDLAVRALSSVCAIAALPVAYRVGVRLGGQTVGRAAVVLLALNPFAVRYATETRMYALVVLLALLGILALLRAVERPSPARLVPVALCAGLLALTHYWTLFLLAAVGLFLGLRSILGADRPRARRLLVGLLAGGVLFLPWFSSFLFQLRHTGTPWAAPPDVAVLVDTVLDWAGGRSWPSVVLAGLLLGLGAVALWPDRLGGWARRRGLLATWAGYPWTAALGLLAASAGTLLLGLVASRILGSGYAVRYSSAALAPALVLAALGLGRLAGGARIVAAVLVAGLGVLGCASLPFTDTRTQASQTAAALADRAVPGDLVVYCPDQLGPAVNRRLPPGIDQVVYPTLGAPQRVDWVDYAERNSAASPWAVATALDGRTAGTVWLVTTPGYRTFGTQCSQLGWLLGFLREPGDRVQLPDARYFERQGIVAFPPG